MREPADFTESKETKLTIIREVLDADGWQGVVITTQASLSWLFGGRYHVGLASEQAIAQVLVTKGCVEGLVANNEHERLVNEEGFAVDVCHVYAWYEEGEKHQRLRAWMDMPGVISETNWGKLQEVRVQLDERLLPEVRHFALVAAETVETVCKRVRKVDTEQQIAGMIVSEHQQFYRYAQGSTVS